MIQRVQSIFLLLAAAAAFALFAFPFASTPETVSSTMFADGQYNLSDNIALLVLFCLAGGLAFVSIFMFKNRKTQLLMGRFAIVANLIGLVLAIALFMQDKDKLGAVDPEDGVGLYLPIAFLIFALLATRFINKDEKLVKSMDRLR